MMLKIKYGFCAFLVMVALTGCRIDPGDIRLEEVRDVRVEGVTLTQARVVLTLDMANDSRVKVTVKEGLLRLHEAGTQVMEVEIREEIVLPKRSETELVVPLTFRFRGAFGALSGFSRLESDSLLVSGSLRLKGSGVNKTVRIEDMPVKDFLYMIGVDDPKKLDISF